MPTLTEGGTCAPNTANGEAPLHRVCAIIVAVALISCGRGERESRVCAWPVEAYRRLDLMRSADRAHLRHDAQSAETIAIHYADVSPARRKGMEEYAQARDECMESLFGAVARNHALEIELVRSYTTMRNRWFDATVLVSFVVVYALVAHALAGLVARRVGVEEWPVAAVAVTALSVGAAQVATMAFDMWAVTAESLRLSSWHLSYRVDRLPWQHHHPLIFAASVGVFWLIALLRYRREHRALGRAA